MILNEMDRRTPKRHPSIPRLVDILEIPPEYQNMCEKLLGSWLICPTESTAIQVQRTSTKWNCVTLDGIQYYSRGEVRKEQDESIVYYFKASGQPSLSSKERIEYEQRLQEKEGYLQEIERQVNQIQKEESQWTEQLQIQKRIHQLCSYATLLIIGRENSRLSAKRWNYIKQENAK